MAKKEYANLLEGQMLNLSNPADLELLKSLIENTRTAYFQVLNEVNGQTASSQDISDTLISKILLGVFGVVPAFDRFFREAAGFHGMSRQFNENSFVQLEAFYSRFKVQFNSFIEETATDTLRYTPMKVIDMYFWKVGEVFVNDPASEFTERLIRFIFLIKEQPEIVLKVTNIACPKTGNRTDDIRNYISIILQAEKRSGYNAALICARDIHNAMNLRNSYPSVCSAMASIPGFKN